MKKLSKIFISCGVALAFSGALSVALSAKNVLQAKADIPDPVFIIGDHDLLIDPLANEDDGFYGEARLVEEDDKYVLNLSGFSNRNKLSSNGTRAFALQAGYLDKALEIKLSGTNILSNSSESADKGYGMYLTNIDTSLTFCSADNEHPGTLAVSGSPAQSRSTAFFGSSIAEIIFDNCFVEFTAEKSKSNEGISGTGNSNITVTNNASISVQCGKATESSSTACVCKKLTLESGTAIFESGSGDSIKDTSSIGLQCVEISLLDGVLTAQAGFARNISYGVLAPGNIVLKGGRFHAESLGAGAVGDSYGIYGLGSSNIVDIYQGSQYFCAKGNTKGCDLEIHPYYEGFGSNVANINDDPSPTALADNNYGPFNYKTILYQCFVYEVNYGDFEYDGTAHQAMTFSITHPATGYTIEYKEEGAADWVDTCPTYSEVKQTSYIVDFRMSAPLFASDSGSVEFYITKADSSCSVTPTKVDDFYYDGDAHELIAAGETDCGTLMYSVNGGDYSTVVPTGEEIGEYEISYKIVGDGNHNDLEPISLGKVTISKANSSCSVAPTKVDNFITDGQSHNLVNPGECNSGTIMYSVNGGEYSATIPTAQNAGEYEISYKVVGDVYHNDLAPVSLGTVIVSEAQVNPDPTPGPQPTPGPDTPTTPETPTTHEQPTAKKGLSGGAIAGIVVASVVVAGVGGFALTWFVILKKTFKDFLALFSKK